MKYDIGLKEALSRTLDRLNRLDPIVLPVDQAVGLVASENCVATVDCPSTRVSLKDGYAVISADLVNVSDDHPVKLKVTGRIVAGSQTDLSVDSGSAVKIMTGAGIPQGANAVIANEFTQEKNGLVFCYRDAGIGRNITEQGGDVRMGQRIACRGDILKPAQVGLLAAGGFCSVPVHPLPRLGIIAIGDEVVSPGKPLGPGQLYASNLVTLLGWLRHFHMDAQIAVVPDHTEQLRITIESMLKDVDVIITSGGVWKSDRDLTVKTFEEMDAETVFHRVRMGPGKAVALIILRNTTIFCLPGGPASNEMAFLQIALPGLFHLAGRPPTPFEYKTATLTTTVRGDSNWTQLFYARLEERNGQLFVGPLEMKSRLQAQANANALIKVPEGVRWLKDKQQIRVQVLFSEIHKE